MKYLFAIMAAGFVAGCTSGNTEADFLCGAQTGQPCATLSDIDGTSTSSGITLAEAAVDGQNRTLTQDILPAGKAGTAVAGVPAGGTPYQSARYRIPEKTGRLWLPPYLDSNKILHEGTYVHFVVTEARWGAR